MPLEPDVLRKLDAGLLRLTTEKRFVESEQFPVFVTPRANEMERLVTEIESSGGHVRHVLNRTYCVAAWIPLHLVTELAEKPFVEGLEMSQNTEIAH